MSNFKYGASCTEVMYKKLEHPTDNLKDTRLFICRQAKNRQMLAARGAARGSRLAARGAARGSRLNAVSPASPIPWLKPNSNTIIYPFLDSHLKRVNKSRKKQINTHSASLRSLVAKESALHQFWLRTCAMQQQQQIVSSRHQAM